MLSVLLVVVGFLAMWQIFALITQPPEYLLPSPIAIGKELSIAPGWYFSGLGSVATQFLVRGLQEFDWRAAT